MSKQTTKPKAKAASGTRPYNRYNLYFILERENLIVQKGGKTKWMEMANDATCRPPIKTGYEHLNLPSLPPRFAHLFVPEGWCIPGQPKRRPHRKTHGVASFRELARDIADSWKAIDPVTLLWCTEVEKILKVRRDQLKKNDEATKTSKSTSTSAAPVAKKTAYNTGARQVPQAQGVPMCVNIPDTKQVQVKESNTKKPVATPSSPFKDILLDESDNEEAKLLADFIWDPAHDDIGTFGVCELVNNKPQQHRSGTVSPTHNEAYASLVSNFNQARTQPTQTVPYARSNSIVSNITVQSNEYSTTNSSNHSHPYASLVTGSMNHEQSQGPYNVVRRESINSNMSASTQGNNLVPMTNMSNYPHGQQHLMHHNFGSIQPVSSTPSPMNGPYFYSTNNEVKGDSVNVSDDEIREMWRTAF